MKEMRKEGRIMKERGKGRASKRQKSMKEEKEGE